MGESLASGGIVSMIVQMLKSSEWPKNATLRKWLTIAVTVVSSFWAGFVVTTGTDGERAMGGLVAVLSAFGIYHGSSHIPVLDWAAKKLDEVNVVDRVRKLTGTGAG